VCSRGQRPTIHCSSRPTFPAKFDSKEAIVGATRGQKRVMIGVPPATRYTNKDREWNIPAEGSSSEEYIRQVTRDTKQTATFLELVKRATPSEVVAINQHLVSVGATTLPVGVPEFVEPDTSQYGVAPDRHAEMVDAAEGVLNEEERKHWEDVGGSNEPAGFMRGPQDSEDDDDDDEQGPVGQEEGEESEQEDENEGEDGDEDEDEDEEEEEECERQDEQEMVVSQQQRVGGVGPV
jgi:hypothetical protein